MTKKIHVRTKIFFSNPYVVRIDHNTDDGLGSTAGFRKIKTQAYKSIQGTWGWSPPEYEIIKKDDKKIVNHWAGIFDESILRSYWCFANDLDALQFRLMIGNNASQVYMWPERWFTIYEE